MAAQIYRLAQLEVALQILRPEARFTLRQIPQANGIEIGDIEFLEWDDPRPQPERDEILDCIQKIMILEDSVTTIYTEDQKRKFGISDE
jgi:hypothetical protein